MRAYKVFNPDFTCKNFKFEVGGRYKIKEEPVLCQVGFHACIRPNMCFSYYTFDTKNIVCEVEIHGKYVGDEAVKICTNDIEIIRKLEWSEVLSIVNNGINNTGHSNTGDCNTGDRNTGHSNTGDSNTGHRNTGDSNTGHRNTGDRNTGDWNTGHWNTGDWNTGHWNTGFLNTNEPKVRVFNKETDILRNNIKFPEYFYFDFKEWVWLSQMTKEEIEANPSAKTCNGFLREISYQEAWKKSFENASQSDIELTRELPNFDAQLFFEISGIDYFLKNKDLLK